MSAAAKSIPDANRLRLATPPAAAASPRAATPTPPREDVAALLRNSPFPSVEEDAEDDAAVLARATERANRLLGRHDAPRDTAYLHTLAWERHCKGVATADIADEFDVPTCTVRSWIAAIRDDLASDLAELRQTHLLLAVDGLRRLLATTWELLEVERDATLPLLESLAVTAGTRQEATRARPSQAPRYILAALAIQKELDRLLALNATVLAPTAQRENAAETATPSPPPASEVPAESATPPPTTTDAPPDASIPPLPPATNAPKPPIPSPRGPLPRGEKSRRFGPTRPRLRL